MVTTIVVAVIVVGEWGWRAWMAVVMVTVVVMVVVGGGGGIYHPTITPPTPPHPHLSRKNGALFFKNHPTKVCVDPV